MLSLADISRIDRDPGGDPGGYVVAFADGRAIRLAKRRALAALLVLLHRGAACESDLAKGNAAIPEIRAALGDRLPDGIVADHYGDANKPFSELWNEEGFAFVRPDPGARTSRSMAYVLRPEDHWRLFLPVRKAGRRAPLPAWTAAMLEAQRGGCNLCGSRLARDRDISAGSFFRDRQRMRADHRVPVEKGGGSGRDNYQLLCFTCNKHKWQVCSLCRADGCGGCALAFPETSAVVRPTGEDIADRMARRSAADGSVDGCGDGV